MHRRWKLESLLITIFVIACGLPCWAAPRGPLPVDQHTFETFMTRRDALTSAHQSHWNRLATRLLADKPVAKTVATHAEARAMFRAFRDARVGTRVLVDGCAPRADIGAQAIERAGFIAQKVNRLSLSGPLVVEAPGQSVKWLFHVAPAVKVLTPTGRETLRVLDPSLFDRPVALRTWEKRMQAEHGITLVTGPDQQSYDRPVLAGNDRMLQLGRNLAAVSSLRSLERSVATGRVTVPRRN